MDKAKIEQIKTELKKHRRACDVLGDAEAAVKFELQLIKTLSEVYNV